VKVGDKMVGADIQVEGATHASPCQAEQLHQLDEVPLDADVGS
jgi:hypothetical protein